MNIAWCVLHLAKAEKSRVSVGHVEGFEKIGSSKILSIKFARVNGEIALMEFIAGRGLHVDKLVLLVWDIGLVCIARKSERGGFMNSILKNWKIETGMLSAMLGGSACIMLSRYLEQHYVSASLNGADDIFMTIRAFSASMQLWISSLILLLVCGMAIKGRSHPDIFLGDAFPGMSVNPVMFFKYILVRMKDSRVFRKFVVKVSVSVYFGLLGVVWLSVVQLFESSERITATEDVFIAFWLYAIPLFAGVIVVLLSTITIPMMVRKNEILQHPAVYFEMLARCFIVTIGAGWLAGATYTRLSNDEGAILIYITCYVLAGYFIGVSSILSLGRWPNELDDNGPGARA